MIFVRIRFASWSTLSTGIKSFTSMNVQLKRESKNPVALLSSQAPSALVFLCANFSTGKLMTALYFDIIEDLVKQDCCHFV